MNIGVFRVQKRVNDEDCQRCCQDCGKRIPVRLNGCQQATRLGGHGWSGHRINQIVCSFSFSFFFSLAKSDNCRTTSAGVRTGGEDEAEC